MASSRTVPKAVLRWIRANRIPATGSPARSVTVPSIAPGRLSPIGVGVAGSSPEPRGCGVAVAAEPGAGWVASGVADSLQAARTPTSNNMTNALIQGKCLILSTM